jgi:hypothetical protein
MKFPSCLEVTMLRLIVCLLVIELCDGCTELPPQRSAATRYCSVRTAEPCLDQVRTGNCQPCPD